MHDGEDHDFIDSGDIQNAEGETASIDDGGCPALFSERLLDGRRLRQSSVQLQREIPFPNPLIGLDSTVMPPSFPPGLEEER